MVMMDEQYAGGGARRTFKEKLLASLSEAEAEAAARDVSVVKDKQQLLIDMLMEGHPQSFVDFFYLTTTGDGVGDDEMPSREELEARGIDPVCWVAVSLRLQDTFAIDEKVHSSVWFLIPTPCIRHRRSPAPLYYFGDKPT